MRNLKRPLHKDTHNKTTYFPQNKGLEKEIECSTYTKIGTEKETESEHPGKRRSSCILISEKTSIDHILFTRNKS